MEMSMKFVSTRGKASPSVASEAILKGLAPDGGLYVPEYFPSLAEKALDPDASYLETAAAVLAPFFSGDPLEDDIAELSRSAFNFPVPLHWFNRKHALLELFHGPTAAFKDFGARFLAAAMEKILERKNQEAMILVATSGDTGGAVASAFHRRERVRVKVLFPLGGVSERQQKQLTCWGDNIDSYAVRGNFDDCQRIVKEAFMDEALNSRWGLTSANSINLGRLLPQMIYYIYASVQYRKIAGTDPVCIIPSGNVGNSVGAYWAKAMGAPISEIILGVNSNRTIPDFLDSGVYQARKSKKTLANAMDVGDPSNMERLRMLFPDIESMRRNVSAYSVDDEEIRETIRRVFTEEQYIMCPHTAVGERVRSLYAADQPVITVSTAHPAKFDTIVEPVIGEKVPVPHQLEVLLHAESRFQTIEPSLEELFPE